jgi:hypothetical protein
LNYDLRFWIYEFGFFLPVVKKINFVFRAAISLKVYSWVSIAAYSENICMKAQQRKRPIAALGFFVTFFAKKKSKIETTAFILW